MTITVGHSFVSAKSQGSDVTVVSKNEWNAAHSLTCASGVLIGRTTAAAGAFEEITPNATDFSYTAGSLGLANPIALRILTADATGSDVNTAQVVFPTTGSFTAAVTTSYDFEAAYHITRAAGVTSHTTAVLFGGTATFTSIRYQAFISNPTGNVLSNVQNIVGDVATAVTLTAANTSATENLIIYLRGNMRINSAGTVIPQFQYSVAPGGAPTIKANSFFLLRKVGTNAVASIGAWA